MKISYVSGNTTKRAIFDIDLNDYMDDLHTITTKITTASKKNYSNIKTVSVGSSFYSRLDSSMPAVAFVNFSTSAGGLFLTNSIPPSYVKSFTCERISNDVGNFTLELQCPISTFNASGDDLNIKLINLFGHIDSDSVNNVEGYKCSLSYGWRGSSSNSVITYDNALVTGMTLNYSGNYYTYTITGLVNNVSDKTFETGVKILPLSAMTGMNTENMSESALDLYNTTISEESNKETAESLIVNSTNTYKIIIPAGTPIYKLDNTKNPPEVTATSEKTSAEIVYISAPNQSNTCGWSVNYQYCHSTLRGAVTNENCYKVTDLQYQQSSGDIADQETAASIVSEDSVGLDLTSVKKGQRISDKVEILANYLYGDKYTIIVAHKDKEYTEDKAISTILKEIDDKTETDIAKDDVKSDTTNETTTSLHTWLRQMIRACQDTTEADTFTKYEKYDVNGDKIISSADVDAAIASNQTVIADKWKKYSIGDYYKDARRGGKDTNAFETKMSEDLFNLTVTADNDGKKLTYADYTKDFDTYQSNLDLASGADEINELLDSYGGIINGQAAAVQYYMYFMDRVAGQSKGKIYIGPARDDASKYQYTVGNNLKNSTVTSFSTSENLIYMIAAVKSYVSAANSGLYKVDPTTGAIVTGNVDTSSARIDTKEEYATRVANDILSKIATGHLSANLQLLSDSSSRKIQTTDNISILCRANGGKSLLSGNYMVSSVKDTIDESGTLTTDISLQFTQSSAFETVKKIILSHLNNVTIETP